MVSDIRDDFLPSDRLPRREIDLSHLGRRMSASRAWLIGPALFCLVASTIAVNIIAPRYTAETKILLENQESYFGRTDKADAAPLPDDEAVQSQVQLLSSRDLARSAIRQLGLQGNPEFDPLANGVGPITRMLVLLGLERDPLRVAPEDRMLENYNDKLTVFPVNKSRVLTVEFESKDPDLAARAANTIASLYLEVQGNAKRESARAAADSLRTLIAGLREKAADAEQKAQAFRSKSGLMLGINNTTISTQQLADLSTQLAQARSAEADSQAKAQMIRDMIKGGRVAEVSDVANNDLIRKISEQRATVQAEIAVQSRTLLSGHPRMQELKAQLADLDRQLRSAGEKVARAFDNDALVAAGRVDNLNGTINNQKAVIGATGGDQVKLNELDLNARLLKDQLELNTSKYQEAVARENAASTPADARIISAAAAPQDPSFPKKLPIIAIATIAGALLSLGIVIAREFLSGRAFVADEEPTRLPVTIRAKEQDTPVPAPEAEPTPAARPDIQPIAVEQKPLADEFALRPSLPAPAADERLREVRDPFLSTFDALVAQKMPERGLRILVGDADPAMAAAPLAMRLGRLLSRSSRTIVIDASEPTGIEGNGSMVQHLAGAADYRGPGFDDLLSGNASFAEVIHRDVASRLHFVSGLVFPSALDSEKKTIGNLLDALAQTYDYVVTCAPSFGDKPLHELLTGHTDAVVVSVGDQVETARIEHVRALFGSPDTGPAVLLMKAAAKEQPRPIDAAA